MICLNSNSFYAHTHLQRERPKSFVALPCSTYPDIFSSVERHDDDGQWRQRHRQALGDPAQAGQEGRRWVLWPGWHGKAQAQHSTHCKSAWCKPNSNPIPRLVSNLDRAPGWQGRTLGPRHRVLNLPILHLPNPCEFRNSVQSLGLVAYCFL